MTGLYLSMGLIVAAGALLRLLIGKSAGPEQLRKSVSALVLYALLPALVFDAAIQIDLGASSLRLAYAAALGAGACVLLGLFVFGFLSLDARVKGALILAAAFGSLACIGLPAPRDGVGAPVDAIARPTNLAVTLLLTTAGAGLAYWFAAPRRNSMTVLLSAAALVRLPPFWAAAAAVALRYFSVPVPEWVLDSARTLGACAAGLLLLNVGMALRVPESRVAGWVVPALAVKLAAAPFAVLLAARLLGAGDALQAGAAVEAALPADLAVVAVADRFGLDAGAAALAAAAGLALSYVTIPIVRSIVA